MFSDNLLVFTRQGTCWKKRTPNGIGWFPHLLTMIDNAGKRTDEFDFFLKQHVEDPAAPALKKMAQTFQVDEQERCAIALLIALTAARSPCLLNKTKNEYLQKLSDEEKEELCMLIQTWSKATGQPCMSLEEFLKPSQFGAVWVWAKSFQKRLLQWKWHILQTTRNSPLVTSDWPVYAEWEKSQGIRLVSFPVSSEVAFIVHNEGKLRLNRDPEQDVCVLNQQTMKRATDFIVACRKDFPGVEFLAKW